MQERNSSRRRQIIIALTGFGMTVGSELIVSVFLALYIGKYVDQNWNWKPYGTLIFVILFLSAALIHIFILLSKFQKKLDQLKETE